MLIDFIAGTKPDLYTITPVITALQHEQDAGKDIGYRLIYTGSKSDFETLHDSTDNTLNIQYPNIFLDVIDSHTATFTANVLIRYERLLKTAKPDTVMIFGHSTGAMACALAAAKVTDLRIAHIGSGMRTYNRNSEDEVNRKVIDAITDYHFPIAQSSGEHLRNEGVPDDYIFFVGNPIADFLNMEIDTITQPAIWNLLQLQERKYILLQLGNPSVAGSPSRLKALLLHIIRLSKNLPIILSANALTAKTLTAIGVKAANLHIISQPDVSVLYYLSRYAKVVITDTEQLQDETTLMQVPCMTLLKSVARPDTHTTGFNEITGLQPDDITEAFHKLFADEWKKGRTPYLWDGKAASRILSVLKKLA